MPSIEDMYPLSATQQGLLFHSLLSPHAGIYVPQIVLTLSGQIDSVVLKGCWLRALVRHSVLRTGFQWKQRDEPFQVVYRDVELPWIEQDWSAQSNAEHDRKLKAVLAANRTTPFNLHSPPLARFHWIRRSDDICNLIFCYHHMILDGWSAATLLKEVLQDYFFCQQGAAGKVRFPQTRFGDYIAWVRKQDSTEVEQFWRERLDALPAGNSLFRSVKPEVDLVKGSNSNAAPGMDEQAFVLSTEETQEVHSFLREYAFTLNSLLIGVLGILFGRHTSSRDVTFGTTVAGRPPQLQDSTSMVGLFINTLPVRLRIPTGTLVSSWLEQVQREQNETVPYEHVSLRDLQTWVNNGQPLFDCLFVLESYPLSSETVDSESQVRLEQIDFDEWTHFPLTLLVTDGKSLSIRAKFQHSRLESQTADRILNHLKRILLSLVRRPDAKIEEIEMLGSSELQHLMNWNSTDRKWETTAGTLSELLEQYGQNEGEAVRILGPQRRNVSYAELHARANGLAADLRANCVGPEQRVAIHLERSLDLAVSVLAVMKAGGTYVPLDPDYPTIRRQAILDDIHPTVMITNRSTNLDELEASVPVLDLAMPRPEDVGQFDKCELFGENAAYVIYTSGSTGTPKGVVNTHAAIVNRLLWMQNEYGLTSADRVLQKTPVGFDVSVWEIFWPLTAGATMVFAEPGRHKDSRYLVETVQQEQITTMHFVPPMLDAFLEEDGVGNCKSLRRVICSGDSLSVATQQRFQQKLPHARLDNLYGPTEAAIDVTSWNCGQDLSPESVPIGKPIANTAIYLLDDRMERVPVGVAGELYIGGRGLARGYWGRPEQTAQSFLPNPFRTKVRSGEDNALSAVLYRTGDIGRYRPDGAIEFLGRIDNQIKLRGVRIELGEIESAIATHPSVQQAVVVLREKKNGESALIAYITLAQSNPEKNSAEPSADELHAMFRVFLGRRLPETMIPMDFVVLAELPLTKNGKVNRSELPAPPQRLPRKVVPPTTETECSIAAVWQEVLDVDQIDVHDSFFDLGGHSLNATRVSSRLQKQFEVDLELERLFEYPVLQQLANHIDALRIGSDDVETDHVEIEIE